MAGKVVGVGALMDEAKKMAKKLGQKPAFSLKVIKAFVGKGMSMDLQSALAHGALFSAEDQKEGMRAFVEKRKPNFKGK